MDIAPFMDEDFRNNIILTQTEMLTMNNRPPNPKTARNKNVLIIGGSGSSKTRNWLKPNLMQCGAGADHLQRPQRGDVDLHGIHSAALLLPVQDKQPIS